MGSRFHFTEKTIRELPAPEKRSYYRDEKNRTLELVHEPTGRKTFFSRVWSSKEGKTHRIQIGTFPAWTPEKARKIDNENVAGIQRGDNPSKEKREYRNEITLGQLYELLTEQEFYKRRQATIDTYNSHYRNHLSAWASKRLSEITGKNVLLLRNEIHKTCGPYAANAVLRLLNLMYRQAVRYTDFKGISPTTGIEKYQETKRRMMLEREQIIKLVEAIDSEPDETMRDIFRILLHTGARKGNVLAMNWEDINLKHGIWLIPARTYKNRECCEIMLSTNAQAVLRRRRLKSDGNPWVFPAESRSGHVVELGKAKKRILERAGIENFRVHDFRHLFASMLNNCGVDPICLQKSMGHKDFTSTLRYVHPSREKRLESVEAVSTFINQGDNTDAVKAAGS